MDVVSRKRLELVFERKSGGVLMINYSLLFTRTYLKIENVAHSFLFRHAGLDPASSKQLFLLDSDARPVLDTGFAGMTMSFNVDDLYRNSSILR